MNRYLEAHSGFSALLVEKSKYDGIWVSSLTSTASRGLPDNELITPMERAGLVREIRRVAKKPIIVDVDTGGQIDHFPYFVKELESAGANAIIMEDKAFPKINSLAENAKHNLEDIDKFCDKIKAGKAVGGDISIYARIESLIAKKSLYEALVRSEAYLGAGVDGIMIHSKQKVDASEVMDFAKKYKEQFDKPLICVPTTYTLPEEHPFDIVIEANHLLRASLEEMKKFETFKTVMEQKGYTVKKHTTDITFSSDISCRDFGYLDDLNDLKMKTLEENIPRSAAEWNAIDITDDHWLYITVKGLLATTRPVSCEENESEDESEKIKPLFRIFQEGTN